MRAHGKKIRYWDEIPAAFGLHASAAYAPCPFAGESFQYMRNLVLGRSFARSWNKSARAVLAYADGALLPTALKVSSGSLFPPGVSAAKSLIPVSYQAIIDLAERVDSGASRWPDLRT